MNVTIGFLALAICLLLCASRSLAQAIDPFQGYDPRQPLPLQTISPNANGQALNGQTITVSPPLMNTAPARPSNWPGRGPRSPRDNQPGTSLEDSEPFDPGEAERLARGYREQAQRRVLGGPPSRTAPVLGPAMQSILAAPYAFEHREAEKVPTITISRPLARPPIVPPLSAAPPAPPRQGSLVQPVVYNGPEPAAPPPGSYRPPRNGAPSTAPGAVPTPAAAAVDSPKSSQLLVENPNDDLNDPTTVLARVDQEVILLGDIILSVNEVLTKNADKIPPDKAEEIRKMVIMQNLFPMIQVKLLFADAKRKIPKEAVAKIEKKLDAEWEKSEYKRKLQDAGVQTRSELEAEFRRYGTSLAREKKLWIEAAIAGQWRWQSVKRDEEVTHMQMLERYHATLAKYEYAASVRWEEIKVPVSSPQQKREAWQKLATAGDRVLAGVPFAEVAKQFSSGATAAEGGVRDWTTKGSLASDVLNRNLFTLPIGRLSPIIEDEQSLYILRVLERREAGVTPFTETQAEIKKQIQEEQNRKEVEQFMAKVNKNYQVWTIFDAERKLAEKQQKEQAAAEQAARNKNSYLK